MGRDLEAVLLAVKHFPRKESPIFLGLKKESQGFVLSTLALFLNADPPGEGQKLILLLAVYNCLTVALSYFPNSLYALKKAAP